jgi:hypothetical protein
MSNNLPGAVDRQTRLSLHAHKECGRVLVVPNPPAWQIGDTPRVSVNLCFDDIAMLVYDACTCTFEVHRPPKSIRLCFSYQSGLTPSLFCSSHSDRDDNHIFLVSVVFTPTVSKRQSPL